MQSICTLSEGTSGFMIFCINAANHGEAGQFPADPVDEFVIKRLIIIWT